MCCMAIEQSQQLNKTMSQVRAVPETGQAGRGLAACMRVQLLLHRFMCLTVISGARL